MNRRSIIASLLSLPALLMAGRSGQAQDSLTSRPAKWTCPYCKGEFEARVLYNNHREVRFFTVGGEYLTCSYEVGRKMVNTVNCRLTKER
jgi:hypothetical protein